MGALFYLIVLLFPYYLSLIFVNISDDMDNKSNSPYVTEKKYPL